MKHEYLNIGYIRSNCLSKVASCIDDLPKTQFSISRSRQEKKKLNSQYRWLQYNLIGKGDFQINWNVWRDKTPFTSVLQQLTEFKNKYHFEDFVINKIEVGIDDSTLVRLINNHVQEPDKLFTTNTRFYVTFSNKPIAYDIINGWDAKIVNDINLNAIVNLKFKRGVLDITNIESEEKKKKKTSEDINWVLHEKDVVQRILSHLKTDRWFEFPEIKKHFVNGHHPYPGAIRTYERKHGFSKWSFIGEEEVIIEG